MDNHSWLKKLRRGTPVYIAIHDRTELTYVEWVDCKGHINAGGFTFDQNGETLDGLWGISLVEATPDYVTFMQMENTKRKAADLAYHVGKSLQLTYLQAYRVLHSLGSESTTIRFITPITSTLFHEDEDGERLPEHLYDAPLCAQYLLNINKAMQQLPSAMHDYGGLATGLIRIKSVMGFYLQQHIDFIHPSVEVLNGALTGVFEVGCLLPFHDDALDALEAYIGLRCYEDWGEDFQLVDISIPDAVLSGGRVYHKTELESGVGTTLINPTVSIHFHSDHFRLMQE